MKCANSVCMQGRRSPCWKPKGVGGPPVPLWVWVSCAFSKLWGCEGREKGGREEERRAAFSCVYSVFSVRLSAIFWVVPVAHLHELLVISLAKDWFYMLCCAFLKFLAGAWLCFMAPHGEEDKTHSSSQLCGRWRDSDVLAPCCICSACAFHISRSNCEHSAFHHSNPCEPLEREKCGFLASL